MNKWNKQNKRQNRKQKEKYSTSLQNEIKNFTEIISSCFGNVKCWRYGKREMALIIISAINVVKKGIMLNFVG